MVALRGNATPPVETGGKHRRSTVVPIRPEVMAAIMNDRAAFDPTVRGYSASYQVHNRNVQPCPGCGRTHWWVGRTMAECAFCSTALPLDYSSR